MCMLVPNIYDVGDWYTHSNDYLLHTQRRVVTTKNERSVPLHNSLKITRLHVP